ncbi:LysR family transcriptional regulator [Actinokineospora sp. NBRC 105648]|uniref:LysR family transcriptional regulator n=1 Tax=Actinokineospora sp. NBRC 105648 TaxID=3032206 RepID=UPI0024A15852|nr:LysR family transcriptional regulator [Actinokineospora sp. NBRC 105648]GLZ36937.1 transcriptional regulator [Actinokineospora sp. NBRC 105648]
MELDTHHLRLVRAIGETGSLSKAAVLLGISQPAVSTKLKRLEALLGQRLFERCPSHSVVPTPTGELLLRRVSAVLPLMEDLLHDIERGPRPDGRARLRMGSVLAPAVDRILTMVGALHPAAEVSLLSEECGELLVSMVAQRRLELAVVKDYPGFEISAPDEVDTLVITHDPTVVLLPPRHPLAGRGQVDLAELRGERWVLPPPSSTRFHEYFRTACRACDFVPNVAHIVDSCVVTVLTVGTGAVGLSQGVCGTGGDVVRRPLADQSLDRRFVLVWRRDSPLAEHASALAEAVRTSYRARLRDALARYRSCGPGDA